MESTVREDIIRHSDRGGSIYIFSYYIDKMYQISTQNVSINCAKWNILHITGFNNEQLTMIGYSSW